jgi:hypothetical protein
MLRRLRLEIVPTSTTTLLIRWEKLAALIVLAELRKEALLMNLSERTGRTPTAQAVTLFLTSQNRSYGRDCSGRPAPN